MVGAHVPIRAHQNRAIAPSLRPHIIDSLLVIERRVFFPIHMEMYWVLSSVASLGLAYTSSKYLCSSGKTN